MFLEKQFSSSAVTGGHCASHIFQISYTITYPDDLKTCSTMVTHEPWLGAVKVPLTNDDMIEICTEDILRIRAKNNKEAPRELVNWIKIRFEAMESGLPRPNTCTKIYYWVECSRAHREAGRVIPEEEHGLYHEFDSEKIYCNGGGRGPCCGPGKADQITCMGQDPWFDEGGKGKRKRSP